MNSASDGALLRLASMALASAIVLSSPMAVAQSPSDEGSSAQAEPSAADKETARALVKVGKEKLAAEDKAGALEAYRQAHEIMRVPTTGLLVADVLEQLGKLLDAHDAYKQVTLIPAQKNEPAVFETARTKARERIDAIKERIPSLVVTVEAEGGAPLEDVRLVIDGVELTGIAATLPRMVNPGAHIVAATARGHRAEPLTVEVAERETKALRVIVLPLPPEPLPVESVEAPKPDTPTTAEPNAGVQAPRVDAPVEVAPVPVPVPAPIETSQPAPPPLVSPTKRWVVWGAYGGGAAGLLLGTVTGIVSLSAASRALDLCPTKVNCGEDARPEHDRSIALANASNVGFALAGLGAIGGTVALFVMPGSLFSSVEDAKAKQTSLRVAPFVSPTALGLAGTF